MKLLLRLQSLLVGSRGVFLAAVAAGLLCGTAFLGATEGHTVVARFSDADGLVAGNDVRIGGVVAGSVQSVSIGVSGSGTQFAQAVLAIDSDHWPLHQGTTVAVRPRGVLSNVFVEVQPGSAHAPALSAGYIFGTDVTSSPTNLDALSNVFDQSVRESIRTQLQEGVLAFGGGGAENLNQTIAEAQPLLHDAIPLTDVLYQRIPELDRLNTEFDTISGDLAREDANLRGLITNADLTLEALANKATQVQGTLDHAAGTLTTIDQGLKGEEQNLQAIFAKGPQALTDADQAAQLLAPLIANVDPHIPSLDVLLHEFVTATGFDTGTMGGIDTLRVDGTLPPTSRSASECGGEPSEQQNACPGLHPANDGSGG